MPKYGQTCREGICKLPVCSYEVTTGRKTNPTTRCVHSKTVPKYQIRSRVESQSESKTGEEVDK